MTNMDERWPYRKTVQHTSFPRFAGYYQEFIGECCGDTLHEILDDDQYQEPRAINGLPRKIGFRTDHRDFSQGK